MVYILSQRSRGSHVYPQKWHELGSQQCSLTAINTWAEMISRIKISTGLLSEEKMVMSIRSYVLDSIIVNAWICVKNSGSHVPQLAYRRKIAQVFLQRKCAFPKPGGPVWHSLSSATNHRVSDDIRYDGRDHLFVPCDGRRCAYEDRSSRARSKCAKCDVGLCLQWNFNYHTRQ